MYIRMHVRMHVRMYVCMYVCVYVINESGKELVNFFKGSLLYTRACVRVSYA